MIRDETLRDDATGDRRDAAERAERDESVVVDEPGCVGGPDRDRGHVGGRGKRHDRGPGADGVLGQ